MKIPVLAVSVLSLSCALISAPAMAASARLKCSVSPNNQYELQVSNSGTKAIPSGATVHAKITPMRVQGVNPKMVNTDFTSTLKSELAGGSSMNIEGSPFAKSCTANATW